MQHRTSLGSGMRRKGEGEDRKGTDKGLHPSGEPWFSLWGWGGGGRLSERTDDEVGFTGVTRRGIFYFLFTKDQEKVKRALSSAARHNH